MYFINRTAVVLKPSNQFLQWLQNADPSDDLSHLTLAQLQSNCTVLLVPEFSSPEEAMAYVGERFETLFSAELSSWFDDQALWPQNRDLTLFWQFFDLEIHDTVLDLESGDWQSSAVMDAD